MEITSVTAADVLIAEHYAGSNRGLLDTPIGWLNEWSASNDVNDTDALLLAASDIGYTEAEVAAVLSHDSGDLSEREMWLLVGEFPTESDQTTLPATAPAPTMPSRPRRAHRGRQDRAETPGTQPAASNL